MNDWVGMWIGHVLQQVELQGKDPFKVVRGPRAEVGVGEDLAEVGWSVKVNS